MPSSLLERSPYDKADRLPLPSVRRLASAAPPVAGNRGCCLTFHRAAPSAVWPALPNRGFHLDLGYLERLILHLKRTGRAIVTMDEALRRAATPDGGSFVNFSVDDCYRDTTELVVPLFRRLGVPVTLFVTTGIPDGTLRLRNAGLETILLERDAVTDAGATFRVDTPPRKRAAFAAISRRWEARDPGAAYLQFCERNRFDPDALDRQHAVSWDMLAALRGDELVEIGAHTISHPRLSALEESEALAELTGSRIRLEEKLGRPIRHVAFPYGRRQDCSKREFTLARKAGFASAATTRKGLIRHGDDPFRLRRNTLNGAHQHILFASAHLSGFSGVAAQIAGRV